MEQDRINFAGYTIDMLNPENFALKNDYINNLILTALDILPVLKNFNFAFDISRGFLSKKYIKDNIKVIDNDEYKFGEGLAIGIKLLNPFENTNKILKELLHTFNFNIKILFNMKTNEIFFIKGVRKKMLVEVLENATRVVYTLNDNQEIPQE